MDANQIIILIESTALMILGLFALGLLQMWLDARKNAKEWKSWSESEAASKEEWRSRCVRANKRLQDIEKLFSNDHED